MFFCYFALALILLFGACNSMQSDATPSAGGESPTIPFTEIPEEAVVATEHGIQTQNALTQAILPTVTSFPTLTPTQPFAQLPALTAMPNSTPAGAGAYMNVSSNVLGSKYEIQNAYYFDTLDRRERYEIYAGAIAGSGGEYSAQGVVIVHILRVNEKNSAAYVETVEIIENLTPLQVGPLHVDASDYKDRYSGLLLRTSLNFVWFFNPYLNEMYLLHEIPLARLEIAGNSQVAKLKGDSSVFSTNPLPLTGRSPFIARLHLPLEQPPDKLSLSAMFVSPPGIIQYDDFVTKDRAEWRTECSLCTPALSRKIIELGKIPLLSNQELRFTLEPGFYVLIVDATWTEMEWFGHISATYGFLIEVEE